MSASDVRSDPLLSVSVQKGQISSTLNSIVFQQFLFGIYTGIFAITAYTYCMSEDDRQHGHKTSPSWIVAATVITLYILTAVGVSFDWKYAELMFCTLGETRLTIYDDGVRGSPQPFFQIGLQILYNIAQLGGIILADGLLVWRCFHACGSSLCAAILPIGLFIVETARVIVFLYLSSHKQSRTLSELATIKAENATTAHVAGSALVSAAVTSLVATLMICRQIYRHTAIHRLGTRSRYRRLFLTLIQSSGVYSAAIWTGVMGGEHYFNLLFFYDPQGYSGPGTNSHGCFIDDITTKLQRRHGGHFGDSDLSFGY
ncbi:hypothetical protein CPC08DRAFT_726911 [Agrocybe pediades]|nr:hypothetical protein CPC08DRAFT_726911 [Agrocybe pediades]